MPGPGRALHDLAAEGSQVLVATHSPIVASLPGAQILELGEHGLRPTAWEDLDAVNHYRCFLAGPGRYLRHLID